MFCEGLNETWKNYPPPTHKPHGFSLTWNVLFDCPPIFHLRKGFKALISARCEVDCWKSVAERGEALISTWPQSHSRLYCPTMQQWRRLVKARLIPPGFSNIISGGCALACKHRMGSLLFHGICQGNLHWNNQRWVLMTGISTSLPSSGLAPTKRLLWK